MSPETVPVPEFPDWGAALNDQNDDLIVRCDRCQQVCTVCPAEGADTSLDREQWPVLDCVFDDACSGHIVRESLN